MGATIRDVEVFRAGDYGAKGVYTPEDIARIAADYDFAGRHDAPLTVDHVQAGPALGWIRNLRAAGASLFADFVDVADETVTAIRERSFSKRSIELFPKFAATGRPYLKAVTMLGAAAPHVKGLREIAFGDHGESVSFDEEMMPPVAFVEVSNTANGPAVAPNKEEDRMPDPAPQGAAPPAALPPDAVAKFAELEATVSAEREARKAAEARADATAKEFATLKAALFAERETGRFDAVFSEAVKAGRALPVNRDGAFTIFSALPAEGSVVKFGESEGSPRDAYLHAIKTAPVVVEMGDAMPAGGRRNFGATGAGTAEDKMHRFSERADEIIKAKGWGEDRFGDALEMAEREMSR